MKERAMTLNEVERKILGHLINTLQGRGTPTSWGNLCNAIGCTDSGLIENALESMISEGLIELRKVPQGNTVPADFLRGKHKQDILYRGDFYLIHTAQGRKRLEATSESEDKKVTNISNPVFKNCIVNINSNLESATQTILGSSIPRKNELESLLNQLQVELKKAPPTHFHESEAVSEFTKELVVKATRPTPNPVSIRVSAKGLIEAATALAKFVPTIIPITQQIVLFIEKWIKP
jgi:hypothetical protein